MEDEPWLATAGRYLRLLGHLGRYTLNRELAFRGNFLVKVSVEVLWLAIMVAFYRTVFARTSHVANWSEPEYFFFVGCYFAINGLTEMPLPRKLQRVRRAGAHRRPRLPLAQADRRAVPDLLAQDRLGYRPQRPDGGHALMAIALVQKGWQFDLLRVMTFLVTFTCGTAIAYGFMLLLTSLSVWMVRNQSLMEMWWLFSSLARYPKEIFAGKLGRASGQFLHVHRADPGRLERSGECDGAAVSTRHGRLCTVAAAVILLWLSRRFFQHALRSYRSASS